MMKVLCFYEITVHMYETTRRRKPKYHVFLKFYIDIIVKFLVIMRFQVTFNMPYLFELSELDPYE
jgi:hypothetical protein